MSPEMTTIDAAVVKAEIVEYLGNAIEDARVLSVAINDDVTCERATTLGALIKEKISWLKGRRKAVYEPLKAATENVRLEYDTPIKLGDQLERTLAAGVISYKQKKRDEETRARLALEAEAKRVREEAARKEREAAAERERIIKEREALEQKRRDDAASEERRRREAEEAERREVVAQAQLESDARAAQLKAEEENRLKTAQEAHEVGLSERSEQILDKQMPVAPLPAPLPSVSEMAAQAEKERLAREAAAAEERRKAAEKATNDKRLADDAERLRKMDEEAARANAKAAEAESAAAQQITVSRPDDRIRTGVRWKYDVPSEAAFRKLCKAIAEGRAPVEYGGYDPERPQEFRGTVALQKDVTRLKEQFQGEAIGIRTWPEESGTFKSAGAA